MKKNKEYKVFLVRDRTGKMRRGIFFSEKQAWLYMTPYQERVPITIIFKKNK